MNCYLIEAGRLTLIDTGPNDRESWDALKSALRRYGRRVEDLELVILTHQHYDHCGLASKIQESSGAEIAALSALAMLLSDAERAAEADDSFAQAVMSFHGVDSRTSSRLRLKARSERRYGACADVDLRLEDGDLLDLGGLELRVVHRPGHSPTDTIFVDESRQRALVGDHLIAHIASNPVLHCPIIGLPDPYHPPSRLADYVASLRNTASMDLAEALSGHGARIGHPHQLIMRRLERYEQRNRRVLAELRGKPQTAADLVRTLWRSLAEDQVLLALSEVLGHIDLLMTDERVVCVGKTDGVVQYVSADHELVSLV